MCTSFIVKTTNSNSFLSRTMDFGFDLSVMPSLCPRKYIWYSDVDSSVYIGNYSFVGAGKKLDKYLYVDGVNEHGLGCTALYSQVKSSYSTEELENHVNIAPHELVLWILSTCKDIPMFEELSPYLNILGADIGLLDISAPLQWMLADTNGKCVAVTVEDGYLNIKENPAKILTETAALDQHIGKLKKKSRRSSHASSTLNKFWGFFVELFSKKNIFPIGHHCADRFMKIGHLKQSLPSMMNETDAIQSIRHLLSHVNISKEAANDDCYTQYSAIMCLDTMCYYFTPIHSHSVYKLRLKSADLGNKRAITSYQVAKTLRIHPLN
ncbi:linear amide C-N hydrolase [Listeria rocourtiae]|uniref:linear amide C-N hydrolase n=1 Tax=Listeria rocourtiae TaxID=647910 RepID=UPI00162AF4F3|nr:linear amide C-N hydrolase [Listeria rocourtiae]MBC1436048.1 linear amide C-N hydrolase [Listeria rocourtiae]